MTKKPTASREFEELLTAYGDACLLAATADCTGVTKSVLKDYQRRLFAARDDVVRHVSKLERRP